MNRPTPKMLERTKLLMKVVSEKTMNGTFTKEVRDEINLELDFIEDLQNRARFSGIKRLLN